jgi:hypothetical protein
VSFRGVIDVVAAVDQVLDINVQVGGISAQTCSYPFEYSSANHSACITGGQSFNWCSPFPVFNGIQLNCDITSIFIE